MRVKSHPWYCIHGPADFCSFLSPLSTSFHLYWTTHSGEKWAYSLTFWTCHIFLLLICQVNGAFLFCLNVIPSRKPCLFPGVWISGSSYFLPDALYYLTEQSVCIRSACWLVCLPCMSPCPPHQTRRLGCCLSHYHTQSVCHTERLLWRINETIPPFSNDFLRAHCRLGAPLGVWNIAMKILTNFYSVYLHRYSWLSSYLYIYNIYKLYIYI